MRGRTVIVTGVAGFIGSRLAARLVAAGAYVVGIDDLSTGPRANVPAGVEFVCEDVRDCSPALFRGADAVAHLAAKNCLADCEAEPDLTWDVNVEGTRRVFEAAAAAGAARFLLASSSATYERTTELPTGETASLGADSVYGRSKIKAEEVVARRSAVAVDVLRYFNVYGPGQDFRRSQPPVISAFVLAALRDEAPVVFGTGRTRRDYVHVDDLNEFQVTRLLGDAPPATLNVGSGGTASVLDLLTMVETAAAALGLTLRRPVMRPATRRDSVETWADVRRARALGWSPSRTLAQGVRETMEYLRGLQQRGLLGTPA